MCINFTESIHSINLISVGDSTHDYINPLTDLRNIGNGYYRQECGRCFVGTVLLGLSECQQTAVRAKSRSRTLQTVDHAMVILRYQSAKFTELAREQLPPWLCSCHFNGNSINVKISCQTFPELCFQQTSQGQLTFSRLP